MDDISYFTLILSKLEQLEAKLWHSSIGDKSLSYCLYLVTEHVNHLATKFLLLSNTDFLVLFCIHATKFLKTCIVCYVTSYWLCYCCSKNYVNEMVVCI